VNKSSKFIAQNSNRFQLSKIRLMSLMFGFSLAIGIWFLSFAPAGADKAPAAKGVTISPAFQQVSINQDEAEHPVTFRITNNETAARTYDLSAADFNTLGESGGLFFIGTNPTELQKKYGLAKWFSLPEKTITVQPKQTFTLNAKIENLPDLSPGGHYGALMLSQNNQPSGGQSRVSVHPIASSLMFITKLGGDTHKLDLSGVSLKHSLFTLPSGVTLRFQNTGNTHVVPRGIVTLSTPQGRLISRGVINEDSNIILPQTFRQYSVSLQKVSNAYAVGRYELNVSFRFDGIDQYRSYRQSFYIFPILTLVIILLIFSALIASYFFFKKTKPS
jgi:hypothetical protein